MNLIKSIKFEAYPNNGSFPPEAGRDYIVVRRSFGSYTTTDSAHFMKCTFANSGRTYKGFAKFHGSDSQRDQMEISGLNDSYFELIDDVLFYAPLNVQPEIYLDYDLKIYDKNNNVMNTETLIAKSIMSAFLEFHKLYASKGNEECEKRDCGEEYDRKVALLWDKAFDTVMSACFGQEQEGYSMSCPR